MAAPSHLPLTFTPHIYPSVHESAPAGHISIQIKTESTILSPYGRGTAVFEAGAENYGCGEGQSNKKTIK